jgi:CubicO group peptidase (beta-lactamase class C family)
VESATGERFADYVKRVIFDPLGMTNTCYHPSPELEEKMCAQYRFNYSLGYPERVAKKNEYVLGDEYDSGGAGVFTTMDDYVKFAYAMTIYGKGLNGAEDNKSYYNAAKTAGYQFELIQGVLNGYSLTIRNYEDNLLTTTLSNGSNKITMYVNADTLNMSETVNVTASGSCYLVGYGVGTEQVPYEVVSGNVTLQPGQAVICVG